MINCMTCNGGMTKNQYGCWVCTHCTPAPSPQPSAEGTPNPNVTKDWIENKQLENGDPNFFRKQILGEWPSEPAPSGETRGTPEKVCDWKADGWTIDPKILGEIEDDPRVRAEGDPGLEMVEAILLAADWEPLAPEATTKEKSDANARTVGLAGEFIGDVDSTSSRSMDSAPSKGFPVAPGEAVGRETREPYYEDLPIKSRLIEFCKQHCCMTMHPDDIVEFVQSELSTLRRERDQLKAECQPHFAMRVDLSAEFAAKMARLESQVRELTAQRDYYDDRYSNCLALLDEARKKLAE